MNKERSSGFVKFFFLQINEIIQMISFSLLTRPVGKNFAV